MELLFRGGGCMSRKKKMKMEYRFYEVPEKCPVLALLGEKWVQNYGYQIDYLHFHNLLEIGFCYSGEGTVILKEEELPYHGDMFTVVPKNFRIPQIHWNIRCVRGHGCSLMWRDFSQNYIRTIPAWRKN